MSSRPLETVTELDALPTSRAGIAQLFVNVPVKSSSTLPIAPPMVQVAPMPGKAVIPALTKISVPNPIYSTPSVVRLMGPVTIQIDGVADAVE